MKVLVVDNIDSFVYNIVQYIGMLGAEPIVVQNKMPMKVIERIVKEGKVEHFILSPGPKTPESAGISNDIVRRFKDRKSWASASDTSASAMSSERASEEQSI